MKVLILKKHVFILLKSKFFTSTVMVGGRISSIERSDERLSQGSSVAPTFHKVFIQEAPEKSGKC